jgi:phosphoribosyl 1,2-cyclic phosphodiesterase
LKLVFLGTRGEIEARSRLHRMHSSLEVGYRGRRVTIDAGFDWLEHVAGWRTAAIVLTHAHPDHAWGLRRGAPCPVYATAECWSSLRSYPIADRRTIEPRVPFDIGAIRLEAFAVEHSIRAPAVGYRVTAGRVSVFYAPDLIYIHERGAALAGARAFIGDGATLVRSFVRRRGDRLIGHAPVRTQLGWCAKEKVPRMLVTHCGSEIVTAPARDARRRLRELARPHGVDAELAYDGLTVVLR